MTPETTRRPERLILLEGSLDMQKLIVTWQVVGARQLDHDETLVEWERISGVYRGDIERIEPVMFENELIGDLGWVDPDVLTYIRTTVKTTLEKSRAKGRS